MKSVWIDEGSGPDYPLLDRYGFRRLYFSARRHTKADIDGARAQGYEVGIYRVPEWDAGLGAREWADLLSADVGRLGGNGTQLAVQADIETHNQTWITLFLQRWREHRALRDTSWTMEGFQGGWMTTMRQVILAANVQLVPQAYAGDMTPWDTHGVVQDLVAYGFPPERIVPFYDGADLRRGWDGYVFTQQRLPLP